MNLKAREVLNDLKYTVSQLEDELPMKKFNMIWTSAITQSRAIGHVLFKKDALFYNIEDFIKSEHEKNKRERIFKEFIEEDRNLLLKEYEKRVKEDVFVLSDENGNTIGDELGNCISTGVAEYVLEGTIMHGKTPREAMNEVINWWDDKLIIVENYLMNKKK